MPTPDSDTDTDTQQLLQRLAELERRVNEQAAELHAIRARPAPVQPDEHVPELSDRRRFMRSAAAAATGALVAGAAVLAESSPAAAANNDPLIIGSSLNSGSQATGIAVTGTSAAYGIGVTDDGLSSSLFDRPGLLGHAKGSNFLVGVLGLAENTMDGVMGRANGGIGVRGLSNGGPGVSGFSEQGSGVFGTSNGWYGGTFRGGRAALLLASTAVSPPIDRVNEHFRGELEPDHSKGDLWYCVQSGTPGTWRKLAGPDTSGSLHVLPSTIRVYDSRPTELPSGVTKGALGTDEERPVDCKLANAVPAGAVAAYVNITIISASSIGFLAAFKNGIPYPGNSTLNWDRAGQVVANSAVVALDNTATFRVRARNPVDFLVDVIGYYR